MESKKLFKASDDLTVPACSTTLRNPENSISSQQTQPSLLIQHSSEYPGIQNTLTHSKFSQFSSNPLYMFPILNYSATTFVQGVTPQAVLSSTEFIRAEAVDIKKALEELHEQSPFRRGTVLDAVGGELSEGSSAEKRAPMNSINSRDSLMSRGGLSYASYRESIDRPFNLAEALACESIVSMSSRQDTSMEYYEDTPEKADISMTTKDLILNLHRNFTSQKDDERLLHSLTPASSLQLDESLSEDKSQSVDLTPIKLKRNMFDSRDSFSSLQSDEFFTKVESEDFNMFEWEERKTKPSWSRTILEEEEIRSSEEANVTSSRQEDCQDYLVELLPEDEDEDSRFMYKSVEALKKAKFAGLHLIGSVDESSISSPEDEGPLRVSIANRLFLKGQTASKSRLANLPFHQPTQVFKPVDPKILSQSSLTTLQDSIEVIVYPISTPDPLSPILRKIVICEESSPPKMIEFQDMQVEVCPAQIVHSVPVCGFGGAPALEYSNKDSRSRGYIPYETHSRKTINTLLNPKALRELKSLSVAWLTCGFEHVGVVTGEGKVYTWGYGASGCLGHGDTNTYARPTLVNSIFHENVVYMESGAYHNAALTENGELYVWGRGDVHQLGISLNKLSRDEIGHVALKPQKLRYFQKNKKVLKAVACGEAHTLVLDSEGNLFGFGWAEDGQLGLPSLELKEGIMTSEISQIQTVPGKVARIAAGSIFSACVTDTGKLYVWGNGEQGQLGIGNKITSASFPVQVSSLANETILDIICGESHMLCVTSSGKLYGWGQGIAGDFANSIEFTNGSEIVCYVPRVLWEVEIAHRFVIRAKQKNRRFVDDLAYKLQLLQEQQDLCVN